MVSLQTVRVGHFWNTGIFLPVCHLLLSFVRRFLRSLIPKWSLLDDAPRIQWFNSHFLWIRNRTTTIKRLDYREILPIADHCLLRYSSSSLLAQLDYVDDDFMDKSNYCFSMYGRNHVTNFILKTASSP